MHGSQFPFSRFRSKRDFFTACGTLSTLFYSLLEPSNKDAITIMNNYLLLSYYTTFFIRLLGNKIIFKKDKITRVTKRIYPLSYNLTQVVLYVYIYIVKIYFPHESKLSVLNSNSRRDRKRAIEFRGKIDRFRPTRTLDPPLLLLLPPSPRCVTLTQRHGLFPRVYKCKQRGNGDLHNDMHYATINMRVAGSAARNVTHGRTFRNFGVSSSCGVISCGALHLCINIPFGRRTNVHRPPSTRFTSCHATRRI